MKIDARYNDIKQTLNSILNYPKQDKFAFNLNKIHDLVFAICQDLYSAKWKENQAQHECDERSNNKETWKDLLALIAAFALGFILGGMR